MAEKSGERYGVEVAVYVMTSWGRGLSLTTK